ncbi:hypothetical protein BMS3Bbin11_00614 [bacterium BMS3Bbin11]|nr:hypothetical protein BMS3Abin11_00941 [bacterium BMS3Abin11]GBE45525.1 hypothetical protein BMS3Bbin11_00614 [bacterium BMS3Bbin11]GMT40767.1 MAG: hypothetical protein IEMM0001_1502 [bacterium]
MRVNCCGQLFPDTLLSLFKNTPDEVIREQVSSCQAATCSCCTPAFRENVERFSSEITNQGTKVTIRGIITEEQVKKNVLSCAPKLER